MRRRALDHPAAGLITALLSAATFGASGTFARPLLDAGWSPGAAVALRTGAAGAVLLPIAVAQLWGRFAVALRSWRRVVAFGLVGVTGAQFCYFAAVDRLPVGIALLIEYLGPVVLVIATSVARRTFPPRLTVAGAVVATAGLFFVLDLTGDGHLDPVGIAFAFTAALCVAGYFHLSAQPADDVPPVALAAGGLLVGAAALTLAGLVGALPFTANTHDVDLFGTVRPWWVPMAIIVLVATAFAYVTGIVAATRLGARVASFVGLFEVLFAVVLAWMLLDEVPTVIQGVGGVLILVGVVLVRAEGTARVASTELGSLHGGQHLLGDETEVVEVAQVEDLQVAPLGPR
jgi:drug/metabolite transporter (DMT)-like permease